MWKTLLSMIGLAMSLFMLGMTTSATGEDWPQFKYDSRHSGNVPDRSVTTPLGLVGAVPLTDAIFTAPVVRDGRAYAVDGSGVVFCIDVDTLRVVWTFETRGGKANYNNVSSPALVGGFLHFGTTAGTYYVLETAGGTVVREIACGEPIFSAPVAANDRIYFVTLGARVFALKPDGAVCWTWDCAKQRLGFTGDRWSGIDWLKHKKSRVVWREQFLCSMNLAVFENLLVIPAGGETLWLEDMGSAATLRGVGLVPDLNGSERPATFGQSIDETGAVYRQWHRRDNTGRVEILHLRDRIRGQVETDYVRGTLAKNDRPRLLGLSSVSLRGRDVYRCLPEENLGFSKHVPGREQPEYLGGYPSIASPILLRDTGVYGGLDGSLYVVPLSGSGDAWSFQTPFGKAISAPVAVCDGRIYFGCEDGYLYILGPDGSATLPSRDLELHTIREPLTSGFTDSKYNWFTSYGNWGNTNATDHEVTPPFKIRWIRRFEGSVKHFSTCGGGRVYTHTAEGQIFAVEQETGRLLWRRYFPGVHVSYTSALYHEGRLLVPQAGLRQCRLRCLDAATGELIWEAPFSGSPSWNREVPPIVHKNLAFYMFSTGEYTAEGTGETPRWLFDHGGISEFPKSQKPLVRAWDIRTGEEVWTREFSDFGAGGDDAGMCMLDGTLYYSCYFGLSPRTRRGLPGSNGVTAALDPETGEILWLTTQYSVTSGTTISGKDGRLYMSGYDRGDAAADAAHIWCLDARDGSLVWESEPIRRASHVIVIGEKFVFTRAQDQAGYTVDRETGEILSVILKDYQCTQFTLAEPYLLGTNLDVVDISTGSELISTGPAIDPSQCLGSFVSNGRIFYTSHGSGLQLSMVYGSEAASADSPWIAATER